MKSYVLLIGVLLVLISACDKAQEQANQSIPEIEQEVETEIQVAEDKEFKFNPNSIVESNNNISFSLDDFKYEIKGENWGKITEMTFSILNNGTKNFDPKILVLLYDDKDPSIDKSIAKEEIDFRYMYVGEHTTKIANTDISFDDLDLPKIIKVVLVRAFDDGNRAIAVIETEFIVK